MNRSSFGSLVGRTILPLFLLLAFVTAGAQNVQDLPVPDNSDIAATPSTALVNETAQNWFVEMNSAPTSAGGTLSSTKADKQAFRQNAKAVGLKFTERRSFDVLWNGLSVHLADSSQLAVLSRIPGVKNIYPVVHVSPDPSPVVSPELVTAITMTGADIVQSQLGFTGSGIKVAVMDTGIDYNHPDLGGCFGPGCRVAKGYDFVGDAYDAVTNPVLTPDNDPDDCAGHGTHVSGIIGANGRLKGVAPGVTFFAYRVFGCVGSTDSDIMISAMERALADGAQILNMSIGSAFTWPQYPTAIASNNLVNKGVVVVASIGNSGANGLYSAGSPGLGSKVIGVASVDNIAVRLRAFTESSLGDFGFTEAAGAPTAPTSGTYPLVRSSETIVANDGCSPFTTDMTGKIVLIRRGTCGFYVKAFNAQTANAAGVVLFNNAAGFLNPTVAGSPAITIPVIAIRQVDGNAIHAAIGTAAQTLTWHDLLYTISVPDSNGGLISSFSSYGLSPDLTLKPDIAAPGGNIYSTYPLELGGYANLSGTSMASPHTAGIVALYLQAHPKTNSQVMRSILQNTASPRLFFGAPTLGLSETPALQGAGLVQADKAILATTRIEPGKLSFGESSGGPVARTVTVTNGGSTVVTYALSYVDSVSVRNTFAPAFQFGPSSVNFAVAGIPATSISLNPGQSVNLVITIAPNSGLTNKSIYGGHIVLTPQGEGQTLRVPYAGFKGDYQSIVAMPIGATFPNLGRDFGGGSFGLESGGATFTLATANQVPYLLAHFDHPSRRLTIEVVDAVSGKSWQNAFKDDYLSRNSTSTGFFAFPFDGITSNGNVAKAVPNGTYYFRVTLVKALGDGGLSSDVETYSSNTFIIARP